MDENEFDYSDAAELYIANKRRAGRSSMVYRRFETAAMAIRHAVEELSGASLTGTVLEVEEQRYYGNDIRRLYEGAGYPLARRAEEAPAG